MCAVAKRDEVRAGSRVLLLVGNPVNAQVLRAHAERPQRLANLHREIDCAQTTLRASVTTMRKAGALTREGKKGATYASEHRLSPAGEEILFVADVLEAWLARAPEGPIAPGSEAAKRAVKALAGGWGSTLMRSLAAQPYSLAELDSLIPHVAYPSLERRLAKMRATRQVAPVPGPGRSTPYVVTDWLRSSIAPLCAAGRCERRHMKDVAAPITDVEVEAALLLSVPLAPLRPASMGTCTLAVHTLAGTDPAGLRPRVAGVTVEVERGRVVSCAARVEDRPPTWSLGTPDEWLDAVIDGNLASLRFGGARPQLAADLVNGVHFALFGG